jgi:hypothetical protein
VSRMRCESIQDQDILKTQDNDSMMQRPQMPPVVESSHSTAYRGAIAAIATMALMAVMVAVMSSTSIWDYGN